MTIKKRAPSGVVDVLRLLVVVFFAGLGYEVSKRFTSGAFALGPLNGVMVGIIIGSGLGYVLGGVLGRTTVTAVGRTEHSLRQTSAEELVAGSFGGVIGVLVGAGVAWWIFLLLQPFLAFPLFGFVVLVIGYLGYRLGTNRREEMLSMFAGRAGMGPRHQATSNLPRIVDTSVAIDGRILDVVRAGFLDGTFLVPSPVLAELQGLADAGDDLRRSKGRRGLQNLEALKREPGVNLEVLDEDLPAVPEVDAKLVRICLDRGLPLLTLDTNLAKAASLAGVHVMNLHGLALALRPPGLRRRRRHRSSFASWQRSWPGRGLPRRRHDGGGGALSRSHWRRDRHSRHECADDCERSHGLRPASGHGASSEWVDNRHARCRPVAGGGGPTWPTEPSARSVAVSRSL